MSLALQPGFYAWNSFDGPLASYMFLQDDVTFTLNVKFMERFDGQHQIQIQILSVTFDVLLALCVAWHSVFYKTLSHSSVVLASVITA